MSFAYMVGVHKCSMPVLCTSKAFVVGLLSLGTMLLLARGISQQRTLRCTANQDAKKGRSILQSLLKGAWCETFATSVKGAFVPGQWVDGRQSHI